MFGEDTTMVMRWVQKGANVNVRSAAMDIKLTKTRHELDSGDLESCSKK